MKQNIKTLRRKPTFISGTICLTLNVVLDPVNILTSNIQLSRHELQKVSYQTLVNLRFFSDGEKKKCL
jgi:hypothetical protein